VSSSPKTATPRSAWVLAGLAAASLLGVVAARVATQGSPPSVAATATTSTPSSEPSSTLVATAPTAPAPFEMLVVDDTTRWSSDPTASPPPNRRLALQHLAATETEPETERPLLLVEPPFLTAADITDARESPPDDITSWSVVIHLSDAGVKRLKEATREHTGERIAILVEGEVKSVPLVAAPLEVDRLTITLADDATAEEARRFASLLRTASNAKRD